MDTAELCGHIREVWDRADLTEIRAAVRDQADRLKRRDLAVFHVGDLVSFPDKNGETILMKVSKVNTKTLSGVQLKGPAGTFGTKWRVSPELVTR